MKYFIYILYNKEFDKFYIGQTYNLNKRILEHNAGLSKYTSKYRGKWEIVYKEIFTTRLEAIKRERFLKNQKNKNFYRNLF